MEGCCYDYESERDYLSYLFMLEQLSKLSIDGHRRAVKSGRIAFVGRLLGLPPHQLAKEAEVAIIKRLRGEMGLKGYD